LEEIIILQDFLEHQAAVNASPSQEDPYLSLRKDFKLITCSVQDLWCSKVELTNPDAARSRSTLVVKGSDKRTSRIVLGLLDNSNTNKFCIALLIIHATGRSR
jgi:hypothetical protein